MANTIVKTIQPYSPTPIPQDIQQVLVTAWIQKTLNIIAVEGHGCLLGLIKTCYVQIFGKTWVASPQSLLRNLLWRCEIRMQGA